MPPQPVQNLPSVTPSTAPLGQFTQQASPADFGAAPAAAIQQIGGVIGQAGDAEMKHALAFQELDNETHAKDAQDQFYRQANNLLFDPTNGYFTKQGKDALDAYGPMSDQLEQTRQAILNGMPNDRARLMADSVIVRSMRNFEGSMGQHAQQQRKSWVDGTTSSLIDSATQTALNFYNDDQKFAQGMATVKSYVLQRGEQNGWSPEQTADNQAQAVSKAWVGRVERTASDNPLAAQDLYRRNMAQFTGTDQGLIEKTLKPAIIQTTTANIANAVMGGHGMPNVPGLFAAQEQAESGGDQAALSGKGAVGIMQLMPDTARDVAAKLGLDYTPDKLATDATFNRTLGQAYMTQMLQRYAGDQTLALAAYNAGPGRVDNWVKMYGDPRAGQISDADWAQRLPIAETRDYVTKVNAASPPNAGTMPTSQDVRTHLADWMGQARTAAQQMFPDNPEAVDQAVSRVITYGAQIQRGAEYTDKQATDTLMSRALGLTKTVSGDYVQTPQAQRPTDLASLLSDDDAKTAWGQADAYKQSGILTLLKQNAKGESPPLTDDAWRKYYELRGMANTDPVGFRNLNIADPVILDVLPHTMTKEIMDLQTRMQGKDVIDLEKGFNQAHALSVVKDMAAAAGVPAGLTEKSTANQKTMYNQWVGALDDAMTRAQANDPNHRPPADDQIRKLGASLLTKGTQEGGGFLGLFGKSTPLFLSPDQSRFTPQVPAPDQVQITAAFRRQFQRDPTQREVADWFMRGQQAPR